MADESVVVELQIGKKTLERVFNENKQLNENYKNFFEREEAIKTLTENIKKLKEDNERLAELNGKLSEEKNALNEKLQEMEQIRRIHEENSKSSELNNTENKLLKMKFQNVEKEKRYVVEQYEKQTRILESMLQDTTKLGSIEERLNEATNDLIIARKELKLAKNKLGNVEVENRRLDKENLDLETEVKNLTRKLRLEEEKDKSNDLAHVECKLLKLKLQNLENENKYLIEEFERERKIISKENKPRIVKLEAQLRKWIEHEVRPQETDEVKALKAQIQTLEHDKADLIEGFELERKVFQKILKANGSHLP